MHHLPQPIAEYVEAANARDPKRVAASFHAHAVVRDEGHVWRGRADIEAWARETGERYQSMIEPAGLEETDGRHSLRARVRGNFPGSPVILHFRFRLQAGAIESLEIGV
jgi:hypothetical protein